MFYGSVENSDRCRQHSRFLIGQPLTPESQIILHVAFPLFSYADSTRRFVSYRTFGQLLVSRKIGHVGTGTHLSGNRVNQACGFVEAVSFWFFGSWKSMLTVVSISTALPFSRSGLNFHWETASIAARMSNGCPFLTSILSTDPSRPMRQFRETLPSTSVCLANSG